ncbi:bifunctional NUDIX hydrolase/phosphatase PAP2 family protein [Vibrio fluminensis]|uniref:bifunctional NUDIX hydrolase/phosphatase PAP2 family protein n=1 Tax=Vibrio fluminensis TaxID=2783614 RepID=UPI001E3B6E97|nr:NUDIX domain-containing protein [Vibrio fluminensis]
MNTVLRNALLMSFLLIISLTASPSFASDHFKGAVCLIRSDNNLVMVKEVLTDKWSLPAGTIEAGEPPQQAAQREVWEETGLVVSVGKELWRGESAIFFDCVSDSDLIAFAQQDKDGGYELPIWFAPDYGVEVSRAHLIDAKTVSAEDYRYPDQWESIANGYLGATSQKVSFVESLAQAAPRFNQLELPWIASLQSYLLYSENPLVNMMSSLVLVGLWFTSPWWLLLLPLCYSQFGRDFTLKLIFTLAFGALVVQMGKLGFQLPRPFVYQPNLNLAEQIGYGLPSLSLTLWTISIAMISSQLDLRGWNRFYTCCAVGLCWLVAALFYSASTFLLDCLIGVLFGWLCAWHMSRLETTIGPQSNELFTKKGVWLLLLMASSAIAFIWQTPALLGLTFVVLATFICVVGFNLPNQISSKNALMLSGCLTLITFGFAHAHSLVNSSNFKSLIVYVSLLPVLLMFSFAFIRIVGEKKPSRS